MDPEQEKPADTPIVDQTNENGAEKPPKRSFWKVLYDWTVQWADRPQGVWALFLLAFAEATFFPIPPDVLLIALCAGAPRKAFFFALVCTAGSVLGGMAGYGIGVGLYDTVGIKVVEAYHGEQLMEKITGWYGEYGFLGNLLAAITPIPYKIFTITSGVAKFNFVSFLLASVIGRSFRFFLVGGVIHFLGPKVRPWIEKHLDALAWIFLVVLVLGFIALKSFGGSH